MNVEEIAALEDRVCLAYPVMRTPADAHARAERAPGVTPYRCPFGRHWHCEALSMAELEEIARMLRDRRDPATSSLAAESQAR